MKRIAATALAIFALGSAAACADSNSQNRVETLGTVPIAPITSDALFVSLGGEHALAVVDTSTDAVIGKIAVTGAFYPHHISLNRDRSQIVLAVPGIDMSGGHSDLGGHGGHGSHEGTGAVLVLDATTGATIVGRYTSHTNHNALYSPDESEIWTTQGNGTALVMDPVTLETRQTLTVASAPAEVTFSGDGKRAFVANTGASSISVLDVTSKSLVATVQVGTTPVGAWQGPNGIAYVDNETDGTLSAIDVKTLRVVATFTLGFVPGMVAFGPDGNVWVADSGNSAVVLKNANRDETIARIPTGAGAHGVAFTGDGKKAYVSNQDEGTVSVIDVATRTTIKTFPIGDKPNGMIWRAK